MSEALVDLTGGLAERWSLGDGGTEEEQRAGQDSDRVKRRRLDLNRLQPVRDGCALSCSTHSSPGGQESAFFSLGIQTLIQTLLLAQFRAQCPQDILLVLTLLCRVLSG